MEEYDWKLLKIERCSKRCLADLMYAVMNTGSEIYSTHCMSYNFMLLDSQSTSAEMLVKIPHRMRVKSLAHFSNLDFFKRIRGVEVCKPPATPQTN